MHSVAPDPAAAGVLRFWFEDVGEGGWFRPDAELDRVIADRFAALREAVIHSQAAGWQDTPAHLLAAIILLDQFGRNIHRGSALAFAADPLALALAKRSLERGWTDAARHAWRHFLLMPLMHSENLSDQDRSVAEFVRLGDSNILDFAQRHREQIQRFGRFPGRNQALGRVSTPAERDALAKGAAF